MKFLVFGSMNIDLVYHVQKIVKPAETVSALSMQKNAGGKGLNQALALAKAGLVPCMAGAVGTDGKFLTDMLEENGVMTGNVLVRDTVPTGNAFIQVDSEAQNSIIVFGGANNSITEDEVDEVLEGFGAGDWVLMQNEISSACYLLKKAKEKGMTVAVNPSPVNDKLFDMPLEMADYLILNEIEGEALSGEKDTEKMPEALTRRYPHSRIVLTLGANGSVYAFENAKYFQEAIKVKAVDTTAAGDTFTGYFLQAVVSGQNVTEALKEAAYAAAIAVSRPGAGPSIPLKNETMEFMGQSKK